MDQKIMSRLQILIGEGHELIRTGLRWILEEQPDWGICAEAGDSDRTVALARELKPDLVILDLYLPRGGGWETTRRIRQALPRAKVIVLGLDVSEQLVREALLAGAQGYLAKGDAPSLLTTAIEGLVRGLPFFTASITPVMRAHRSSAPPVRPLRSPCAPLVHACNA